MRAKDLLAEKMAIRRGTAKTTRISSVYLHFLIEIAERAMHTHTNNNEERAVIKAMIEIVERGYFRD